MIPTLQKTIIYIYIYIYKKLCVQEREKNIQMRHSIPKIANTTTQKHTKEKKQPGARGPLDLLRTEGPGLQVSANQPRTAS